MPSRNLFLLGLIWLCLGSFVGAARDEWQWRSPTPLGEYMHSLQYANGTFLGRTFHNLARSTTGTDWSLEPNPLAISNLQTAGDRFIGMVHSEGETRIAISDDGKTWETHPAPAYFHTVSAGGGSYVALAWDVPSATTTLYHSTEGRQWEAVHSFTGYGLYGLDYAQGTFGGVTAEGVAHISTDGRTWREVAVLESPPETSPILLCNGEAFLLLVDGYLHVSADGVEWAKLGPRLHTTKLSTVNIPTHAPPGSTGTSGGYFYINGSGTYIRSQDGLIWEELPKPTPDLHLNTMVEGDGIWLAYNHDRRDSDNLSGTGDLSISSDGISWSRLSRDLPSDSTSRVVYGLGRFFYGGNASPDGVTWAGGAFLPTHAAGERVFRITTHNTPFPTTQVEVSHDGLTGTVVEAAMPTPRDVTYGQGRYVMVGNTGRISTSDDGYTWTPVESPTQNSLRSVRYLDDRFYAVGEKGTLLHSTDGSSWVSWSEASLQHSSLRDIASDGETLVVVGQRPSSDTTPIPTSLQIPPGRPLRLLLDSNKAFDRVVHDDGHFWAIGITGIQRQMRRSNDGIDWELELSGAEFLSSYYSSIATGNDSILWTNPATRPAELDGFSHYQVRQRLSITAPAAAPQVTHPPVATQGYRGDAALLACGATGTPPFTYQWYHDGNPIAGATLPILRLAALTDSRAGEYHVAVANAHGEAISTPARFEVIDPIPLAITRQPVGGIVRPYDHFWLHVEVSGSGPYSYQWRKDGTPIVGATESRLYLPGTPGSLPTLTGAYDVVVTAPYSTVTSESVEIATGGPEVRILPSGDITLNTGDTLTLEADVQGISETTRAIYEWRIGSTVIETTHPKLVLPGVTTDDAGLYILVVRAEGASNFASTSVRVNPPPTDTPTPRRGSVRIGETVYLRTGLTSDLEGQTAWLHNGVNFTNGSHQFLEVRNVSFDKAGTYELATLDAEGNPQQVHYTFTLEVEASRLSNLSARTVMGPENDTVIVGFVTSGLPYHQHAPTTLLLRSVGPTLAEYGVTIPHPDPELEAVKPFHQFFGPESWGLNDDWQQPIDSIYATNASLDDMTRRGAFPLDTKSKDAAMLLHFDQGEVMTMVCRGGQKRGVVLNELYSTDSSLVTLVNLSVRSHVGVGDNVLIAGFVITGDWPTKLLIRGVGPGLSSKGVPHPLPNPKLILYNAAGDPIHNNDNWGQAANVEQIAQAAETTGAFPLLADSNDAVILESLPPGAYTVHLIPVGGITGTGLIEIYSVP